MYYIALRVKRLTYTIYLLYTRRYDVLHTSTISTENTVVGSHTTVNHSNSAVAVVVVAVTYLSDYGTLEYYERRCRTNVVIVSLLYKKENEFMRNSFMQTLVCYESRRRAL